MSETTTPKALAGPKKGPGRPTRPEPKALPIWCGQIPEPMRELIVEALTPEERFEALYQAAIQKLEATGAASTGSDAQECD